MREINIVNLMSKLIKDYEKACGRARFEMKKIDETFIYTDIDQKLLDYVKLQRNDVIGKTFSDLPIKKEWTEKMPTIFEEAWKGKEIFYYSFPYSNDKIFLVVALKAITNNGKINKIEGCCAPLESEELAERFTGTIIFLEDL